MIVAVAGPKGGAGKTLVATSLALSIPRCALLDCDVEEPNAHLYLRPHYRRRERVTVIVPRPRNWKGADLRAAASFCPFNALFYAAGRLTVFRELCTGCGGCFIVAPEGSLGREEYAVGAVRRGEGRNGIEVVTGELDVGGQRTGRVVAAVRRAGDPAVDTVIDCPPGTARPAMEAVRGSDCCIIVTEATPFGLEDLKAGVEALRALGVRMGVVVNKVRRTAREVADYCASARLPVLMEIPLSRDIAAASARGKALPDISEVWKVKFSRLWERIGNLHDG